MNGTLHFRYETRRMVLGLILQYAMFYNAKCAFFVFFFSWIWWFGGCTIGYFVFANMLFVSVQWLTDLSRNFVFVLFTFFKYVLRYRVCLIFFNCLFCFFCSFNWYYFSLLADSADRFYCLLSRWSPSRPLISVALSRVCTWVSVVCMWDVGMFVVTSSGDQTIFSLTQLSATQLSMTFAEHPRIGALKLAAACSWIWYANEWILKPYKRGTNWLAGRFGRYSGCTINSMCGNPVPK